MARPITKGRKNWKVAIAVSLSPTVIKWLKDKARKMHMSTSKFTNTLLEEKMIAEIEGEF